MKSLHRIKALASYEGARVTIKQDMPYPTYMMLKEAARGVLSYIVEDTLGTDISDKTKLNRLVELINTEQFDKDTIEDIHKLVDTEKDGLEAILTINMADLERIKGSVKKLIAESLKEPI